MTALALASALPTLVVLVLLAGVRGAFRRAMADLPLAAGLAVGLSSIVWWALFATSTTARTRVWIDAGFWILALVIAVRTRRIVAVVSLPLPHLNWTTWIAFAFFAAFGALAVATVVTTSAVLPHGTWDAWAIWNLRARFLSRGVPELWREGFSPLLHWSHPDYPLLVPLSVARGWAYAGSETTAVPILVAALFAVAAAATAAVSVARARGAARGWLAAAAILASPAFLEHASGQIADVPLSFYMLASFVAMHEAALASSGARWWLIAGVSAGLAAWTKNEGLLFLVVFTAASAWWSVRTNGLSGLGRIAAVLCGAAPSLVALAVLKWTIAAPDLLVARQSAEHIAASVGDTARVRIAATALARELWLGGAQRVGVLPIIAAYLAIAGVRRPIGVPAIAGAAMVVMLAGYLFVYVVTPYDFEWHVRTSVERVVLHLFPTLVWCAFMVARSDSGTPPREFDTLGRRE